MTANQLLKLQAGEVVIVRGVKAQDQLGRKTTTDPIFASGRTELPYRYMFLDEEFDQSMTLSDIPVRSPHRGLDLKEIAVAPSSTFTKLLQWKKAISGESVGGSSDVKLAVREVQDKLDALSQEELRQQSSNRAVESVLGFNEGAVHISR